MYTEENYLAETIYFLELFEDVCSTVDSKKARSVRELIDYLNKTN